MLFLGVDWGERHHDLCLLDQDGQVLAARRIPDGLAGVGELHALVAAHAETPAQVVVAIETDRGLLVGALLAAGYQLYAVNPMSSAATAAAMAPPGPSRIVAMPRCWPTWSVPTATTTARSPGTAR
jgi:transposase